MKIPLWLDFCLHFYYLHVNYLVQLDYHLNIIDPYISIAVSKLRFLSISQGEVSLNFLSAVYNYLKELRCKIYAGTVFLRYICGHEKLMLVFILKFKQNSTCLIWPIEL